MGGCYFNYLIKVTPHCLVLCFHRPLVFDKRPSHMLPWYPPLLQTSPPILYVCLAKCLGTVIPRPL